MKACVYTAPGAPLELTELPDPEPGPGEMVVRVKNCGICGSDIHAAHYGVGMPPRTVMGHELSGVVDEIGPGVKGFALGDPVVVMSYLACGQCDECRRGNGTRCARMRLVAWVRSDSCTLLLRVRVCSGDRAYLDSLRLPAGWSGAALWRSAAARRLASPALTGWSRSFPRSTARPAAPRVPDGRGRPRQLRGPGSPRSLGRFPRTLAKFSRAPA